MNATGMRQQTSVDGFFTRSRRSFVKSAPVLRMVASMLELPSGEVEEHFLEVRFD